MSNPIIALNRIRDVVRPFLTIDGEKYEMAIPSDIGVFEQSMISAVQRRFNRYQETEDALDDPDAATKLANALDKMTRTVVRGVPDDVLNTLTDQQKLEILGAFTKAVQKTADEKKTTASSSSKKPSRASSASTAEAPVSG